MLPTVFLGPYPITRLIIGGNPFSGNSHISAALDEEMEAYFSSANIKRTLFRSEECGINTMQVRGDRHLFRLIREYRDEGGRLQWIAQTASEIQPYEGNIRQIVKYDPIAIYHHGTYTDSLFKEGRYNELRQRLQVIRDSGKLVGLGTHLPEVIAYAEEHQWDIDFYMACVHNLSKAERVSSAMTGISNRDEPFDDEDRAVMYRMIRQTSKPCLAFKILGAGRKCDSPATIKAAFAEAFANIKPSDAIVVGMFPRDRDQVQENTGWVNEILRQI
jgi:hypothetical protein